MRQAVRRILLGAALGVLILASDLYADHDIGVPAGGLERDLRASQRIPEDWQVIGSVSDEMAAYLAYPQDLSDHTFSVYINRPGLSFGYFFREGGSLSGVQPGMTEITVEGCSERAVLSMNQQRAAQVRIEGGGSITEIELDPERPFAIVLPASAGRVSFYNAEGEIIEGRNESS